MSYCKGNDMYVVVGHYLKGPKLIQGTNITSVSFSALILQLKSFFCVQANKKGCFSH